MLGLSFHETLTGTLRPTSGAAERAFEFTVTASGQHFARSFVGAPLDLQGTVTLTGAGPGAIRDAPAEGWITIDPVFGRELVYELRWRDAEDRPWRLYAKKDVQLLHLVASMTTLRGTVYREGEAEGTMTVYFRLSDLPAFLRGMRAQPAA